MVKAWAPENPRMSRNLRLAWIAIMEYVYTNQTDTFTSAEILRDIGHSFISMHKMQLRNVVYNARKYLERNGIIDSRKIKFRVGSAGSFQLKHNILNRNRILAVIDLIKSKQERTPAAVIDTRLEAYIPPISVAVDMDKDDIIIALCKENNDLRKEVAELIEERSSRLAAIHDASLKVEEATRKLDGSKRLPASVVEYLKSVGILVEKKDEDEEE